MRRSDLPVLAECLPALLGGNWAEKHLQSQMDSSHEFLVLVTNDAQETVVGFAEFYCVLDEFHLLNFAILQRWQRQGAATFFIAELLRMLRERNCVQCLLEVRRSNVPAVRLYEKAGFVPSGMRAGYYAPLEKDGLREDALLYCWSLPESS
jgi:ribosomal-protein-alanine N-acetyltransferase